MDVGEANGRVFLNNASMGFYPQAVADREKQQDERARASGWPWPGPRSRPTCALPVAARDPARGHGGAVAVTTPLVFIGNNRYEMSLLSRGTRDALDGGELWLYVARHRGPGRLPVPGRCARSSAGSTRPATSWAAPRRSSPSTTAAGGFRIAFDGELCEMESPAALPRAARRCA